MEEEPENQQAWTKHGTASGDTFYGNQVSRGGGHFMGDYEYDLDDVAASLQLAPNAAPPVEGEDGFDQAFAPLRQATEQSPSFRPLVDFLEQELRKGAESNDTTASSLVTSLLQLWPDSLPHLRKLLTISPTRESIGPVTRTVIEQGV
jgi:hypothetical protein